MRHSLIAIQSVFFSRILTAGRRKGERKNSSGTMDSVIKGQKFFSFINYANTSNGAIIIPRMLQGEKKKKLCAMHNVVSFRPGFGAIFLNQFRENNNIRVP